LSVDPSILEASGPEDDALPRRSALNVPLFLAVVGSAIGVLVVTLVVDIAAFSMSVAGLTDSIMHAGMSGALGSLAEVMAAVLGLSLTVVAIVVQLASQRYPARIVDLFMTDRTNITVIAFMASSCVFVVLAPVTATAEKAPLITTAAALVLTVINFGLLLPYFGHVFAFLDPHSIITRIRLSAQRRLAVARGAGSSSVELRVHQSKVSDAIDRIADNSMAAIGQFDRNLSMHTVRSIERLVCTYLESKDELPEEWASVSPGFLNTLSEEFFSDILANRTWVEAKALMEYERLTRHALANMTELVSQLAVSTRAIGEKALEVEAPEVLELTIRFFNTYIRHSLNSRNVRAAYNILDEYRHFASSILSAHPWIGVKVVRHMVYYGRTANTMGLPFVTVTAAHDVRVLCELAFDLEEVDTKAMLQLFLTLDQPSDDDSAEVALLGVRRAQSILGAFFLSRGAAEFAEQIRHDMRDEPRTRLVSTRDAILAVDERKFWEITDRGFNFDYVAPAMRPHIEEFFAPMLTHHP